MSSGVLLENLFRLRGLETRIVSGVAVSSVVPTLDSVLRVACEMYFHVEPLFVEPGIRTGLPILVDNPSEVGADRIVNCVAAFERFGGPTIIVDIGDRDYLRRGIEEGRVPGWSDCSGAWHLRRCAVRAGCKAAANRGTQACQGDRQPVRSITFRSVLYYGYIGLVDGILERMIAETGPETKNGCNRWPGEVDSFRLEVHQRGGVTC